MNRYPEVTNVEFKKSKFSKSYRMTFFCPGCHSILKSKETQLVKVEKCSECDTEFTFDPSVRNHLTQIKIAQKKREHQSQVEAAKKRRKKPLDLIELEDVEASPEANKCQDPSRSFQNLKTVSACLAVVFAFSWLITSFSEPSIKVLFNYLSLIGFGASITVIVGCNYSKHFKSIIRFGVLPVICLVILWGKYDWYTTDWESDSGTNFSDTYKRFGNKHIYRRMRLANNQGWSEGPMSGEGHPVPHGKWETLWRTPISKEYNFYWYGEEVTEGEWHLRNK